MSLIADLIGALGALESDRIAIHEERCISVRNRNARCLRCAEVCTSGAISRSENKMVVDTGTCIGCGTCATACPTCAIELRDPSDTELTKYVKSVISATKGHPVFACETALRRVRAEASHVDSATRGRFSRAQGEGSAYDEAQVCELACLGRLDESVLVGLGAYRALSATLVCGECETCAHAPGGALVREVVESASNLLHAFGSDLAFEITTQLPERVCGTSPATVAAYSADSRRDFFKSVKRGSTQVATAAVKGSLSGDGAESPTSPAYAKVNARGTLSQFVPSRRTRTYNYLLHIGEPVADTVEARIVGTVSIDAEKCSSCRMCAVFCPTGALMKLGESDAFGILHRPAACVQCRLCEGICPEGALVVEGRMPIAQFMGRQALRYDMKKPDWTPNKPDSMYNKVHAVIGDDLEMCMF